ncbi:MAG: nucleoside deaminase [Campylobacterota bacterium]|nr:nucleoside deaminase [Campylobacterota bacterium]
MSIQSNTITFSLPDWIEEYIKDIEYIKDRTQRMGFVIEASRHNVVHKTGGPFAAAIFEKESGKLISLGVNLVASQNLSILHAEMVAITLAQKRLGTYDLGSLNPDEYELVTSTEPCAMCLGAIPWSGLSLVVSAATDSDARAIGFDEGVKVDDWKKALLCSGIDVIDELQRKGAVSVLELYIEKNGKIYNSDGS